MRNLYLILCLLLTLSALKAQSSEIGLMVEGSITTISEDYYDFDNATTGFGGGVYLEDHFDEWSVLLEFAYSYSGLDQEIDDNTSFKIRSGYLLSRWIFNYNIEGEKSTFFIGGGFAFGPRISNTETLTVFGEETTNLDQITPLGFDFNALINIGVTIDRLKLSLRTSIGLIDISNRKGEGLFNSYPLTLNARHPLN